MDPILEMVRRPDKGQEPGLSEMPGDSRPFTIGSARAVDTIAIVQRTKIMRRARVTLPSVATRSGSCDVSGLQHGDLRTRSCERRGGKTGQPRPDDGNVPVPLYDAVAATAKGRCAVLPVGNGSVLSHHRQSEPDERRQAADVRDLHVAIVGVRRFMPPSDEDAAAEAQVRGGI